MFKVGAKVQGTESFVHQKKLQKRRTIFLQIYEYQMSEYNSHKNKKKETSTAY